MQQRHYENRGTQYFPSFFEHTTWVVLSEGLLDYLNSVTLVDFNSDEDIDILMSLGMGPEIFYYENMGIGDTPLSG